MEYKDFVNNRNQQTLQMNIDDIEGQILDKISKKSKLKSIFASDHSYHSPRNNQIYVGETQNHIPTFDIAVKNMKVAQEYLNKYEKTGESNYKDKARIDSYIPDYRPFAQVYFDLMDKVADGDLTIKQARTEAAGAMEIGDFQGLRLIETLGEVVNEEQRSYSLQNAGIKFNTNKLFFRIPSIKRFQIGQDLDENETVDPMKMDFSAKILRIKKDVAHLQWSDEFEMVGDFDLPIMPLSIQNAVSDFERVRAEKIATLLLTATQQDLGSNNWKDYEATSDRSKADPILDIDDARGTIDTAKGFLDRAASNARTFHIFLRNTYVNGQLNATNTVAEVAQRTGVVTNVPRLPSVIWYVDRNFSNGIVVVWASRSLYDIQGITKTSTYREEHLGGNGLYIRNWNGTAFSRDGQAVKIINAI